MSAGRRILSLTSEKCILAFLTSLVCLYIPFFFHFNSNCSNANLRNLQKKVRKSIPLNCSIIITKYELQLIMHSCTVYGVFLLTWVSWRVFSRNKKKWCSCDVIKGCSFVANKILILNRVGWQCDQITAATWSGTNCQPTIMQPFTLITLLFGT